MASEVSRVLVPLDGSTLAERALVFVSALRPVGITQVSIVSAIEPFEAETTLSVETKVLEGPAPQAILEEVDSSHPDYLLISTHGFSGFTRWRLGSVADKVIRGAACPTLVLGPATSELESRMQARILPVFDSILVPLDGSELAEHALPQALCFADAVDAKLHLVSVSPVGYPGPDQALVGLSPRLAEDEASEAQGYLEGVKKSRPALADAALSVRSGVVAEVLADYAAENGINLIVMTSHGRGGILRAALGSTTDRLLGGLVPVLIVR